MGIVQAITIRGTKTVTIATASALSGASSPFGGKTLVAVIFPAGWTANIVSFQVSPDGTNFYDLYADNGTTDYQIPATQAIASACVAVDPSMFMGAESVKVRSGTTASPVNQTGGDIVTLVLS